LAGGVLFAGVMALPALVAPPDNLGLRLDTGSCVIRNVADIGERTPIRQISWTGATSLLVAGSNSVSEVAVGGRGSRPLFTASNSTITALSENGPDSTVYWATNAGDIYRKTASGKPQKFATHSAPLYSLQVVPANRSLLGVAEKGFVALDLATGKVKWSYSGDLHVLNWTVAEKGRVIFFDGELKEITGSETNPSPTPTFSTVQNSRRF
jgi:outer membrane protein assembly factor BamB